MSAPPPLLSQAQAAAESGEFLMNPFGLLYSEVTASSLVRVNDEGVILDPGSTQLGVNRSGVELHSAIYGARRDVKCIMHLHTVAGTAVLTLRYVQCTYLHYHIRSSDLGNGVWSSANI